MRAHELRRDETFVKFGLDWITLGPCQSEFAEALRWEALQPGLDEESTTKGLCTGETGSGNRLNT